VSDAVLDASAILAYLRQENGHAKVAIALEQSNAFVASVNYSEVISSLIDHGMKPDMAVSILRNIELKVVSFDVPLAIEAARLRPATKSLGLSLADRCCIALGRHMRLPVMTADKAWREVNAGVRINLIR
jgi:ribonuclease VapC